MMRPESTRISVLCATVLLAATTLSCKPDVSLDDFISSHETAYAEGALAGKGELLVLFFRNRNGGIYVDVGCSHYKKNSTTFYLEEHQGWSGIGIDPLEYLRPGWAEHRPRSKFFAYAVSDKSGGTLKFFSAGGLSTTELDDKNMRSGRRSRSSSPRRSRFPPSR